MDVDFGVDSMMADFTFGPEGNPHHTHCTISQLLLAEDMVTGEQHILPVLIGEGDAYCNLKEDKFDFGKGRKKAFRRALDDSMLNDEAKAIAWEAYFSAYPQDDNRPKQPMTQDVLLKVLIGALRG